MSNLLRNIVRSSVLKTLSAPIQQNPIAARTVGIRSLWHMSKPSITSNQHRCTGFGGCSCGCGKRFASNGMNSIAIKIVLFWTDINCSPSTTMNIENYITSIDCCILTIKPLWNDVFFIVLIGGPGEKALIEFLQEEIETEKTSLAGHLPSQLDNFQIKYDGAEVELTKQSSNEK